MALSNDFLSALRQFVDNAAGEVKQAAEADLARLEDAEKGPLNEFEDAVFAIMQGLYIGAPAGGAAAHESGGNAVAGVPQKAEEGADVYISPVAQAAGIASQSPGEASTGSSPAFATDDEGNPVLEPLEATPDQTARPQADVPGVDESGAALRDDQGNVTGTGPDLDVDTKDSGKSGSKSSSKK